MEKLILKDYLNPKLEKIWGNYYQNNSSVAPIFPELVFKNQILFLSLNPSLPPYTKDIEYGNTQSKPWRFLDSRISYEENKSVPHFKKFFEIQKEINQSWTFLDLLYIRMSKQKEIEALYETELGKNFILEQANLTLEIIKEIKPKLVIVSNKFVETILHDSNQEIIKFNAKLDENYIYRYQGIPFIIKESKFLGSIRHWNNNESLRQRMYQEINRVLKLIDE